jgi:hypothetical protein
MPLAGISPARHQVAKKNKSKCKPFKIPKEKKSDLIGVIRLHLLPISMILLHSFSTKNETKTGVAAIL